MPRDTTTSESSAGRRLRRPALVFALGGVAALLAAWWLGARAGARHQDLLEREGGEMAVGIETALHAPLEIVAYLPPFFESSEYVSLEEFDHFVEPSLIRQPSVAAVEWAPRVRADELPEFVDDVRQRYFPGFEVRRIGPNGRIEPALVQTVQYPLLYRLPRLGEVLGLDIYQRPEQRLAVEQAIKEDRPTLSASFPLLHDIGARRAVAVFAPVYDNTLPLGTPEERRAALTGVTTVLLAVDMLVGKAMDMIDLGGRTLVIEDVTETAVRDRLYPPPRSDAHPEIDATAPIWAREIPVLNRTWLVMLHQGAAEGPPTPIDLPALAIGLLLAAIAAGGLFFRDAIRRLRRQVEKAQQLGQYTLVKRIGEGGMGVIYRAEHAMLRRPTAVKLISADVVSEEMMTRFEREVRYTSELCHPNTIAVYDYGRTPAGVFYYAMEFIEGIGLDVLVEEDGAQPPARVLHLLKQAAGSLAEAHERGLVHRDIKPQNIMICERAGIPDLVKVLDFGLAKQVHGSADPSLSTTNSLLGTPLYMPPESITDPEQVGPASDVYTLCAVGYYLIVGEPVFTGEGVVEICGHHLNTPPVPPSERRPSGCPADLEAVILRGLAKDPHDRPATGAALLEALEAVGDVAPWPKEEAHAWWEAKGASLLHARAVRQDTIASDASARSLAVDLRRRA